MCRLFLLLVVVVDAAGVMIYVDTLPYFLFLFLYEVPYYFFLSYFLFYK